jgi:hypothetical protein
MKKSSTVERVVHRSAKERRATAARTASWRERNAAARLEVRDLDKTICEAVTMHARSLPEAQQRAFLAKIIALSVDGLAYQGHDPAVARSRLVDRMAYWCGTELTTGTVRAVLDRKTKADESVTT